MKKFRRAAAAAGVILILLMYILTFVFAMMKSEAAQALFRGALGCTILVPVFLYLIRMVAEVVRPSRSAAVDTVIFDLGNVLIDFDWQGYAASLGYSPELIARLKEHVILSETWNRFDYGNEPYEDVVEALAAETPDCADEIRALVNTIDRACSPFWYTKDWITALKRRGYRVLFLSNWSEEICRRLTENGVFDFISLMDGGVWSFKEHVIKPDPKIFDILAKRYDLVPGRCVFLDDNKKNIEAARAYGFAGIVFTGYPDAEETLSRIGIRW